MKYIDTFNNKNIAHKIKTFQYITFLNSLTHTRTHTHIHTHATRTKPLKCADHYRRHLMVVMYFTTLLVDNFHRKYKWMINYPC